MMLSPLHVDGLQFRDSSQRIVTLIGSTEFALFKRWLMPNGPTALVLPILEERKRIAHEASYDGPLVARVMRFAAPPNAFALAPWAYPMAQVTAFTQFCGEHGWYVDWTCGDAQIVLPNPNGPTGQQQHLNEFCFALAGCPNAIIQTCNEPFKNGIDVTQVVPPKWGTYLRYSGAYGESGNWPFSADLDFRGYHPERDTGGLEPWQKWAFDCQDSAAVLTDMNPRLPAIMDEPIGADENDIPGRRSNRPELFARLGLATAYCAGVYFHSTPGLSSDGFGPVVTNCFREFVRGAKAGASL
jgi:hypothetical protein